MKIRTVKCNNHKKAFIVQTATRKFEFPYAKAAPHPTSSDPVVQVDVDAELGREGFTYVLRSGKEGTIHIDQVLEYHQDPRYLRDVLLYKLTIEAQKRVEASGLSKRELVRRLGTSATQLYRLLDSTNYRKSVDQLLRLFNVVDCEVDLLVRDRRSNAA